LIDILSSFLANLVFVFQRLSWFDVVDLLLVTVVFFIILQLLRGTQAVVLLRGVLLLIVLIGLLTSLDVLPGFSWLVQTTFPALLLAIPVIFAPEIRRALEKIGRAGEILPGDKSNGAPDTITSVVNATTRLSDRQHGALIVFQRRDALDDYIQTGVPLDAKLTPEILLQIFYPNTPLHDGAVIVSGSRVRAAACVMPLSASGVLTRSPDRQMGLRHRAALGISEVSDAVAIVVSEETGSISIVHSGRMIRRLDADRLANILQAFFRPAQPVPGFTGFIKRIFKRPSQDEMEE
jgi:diadenylate cyclase